MHLRDRQPDSGERMRPTLVRRVLQVFAAAGAIVGLTCILRQMDSQHVRWCFGGTQGWALPALGGLVIVVSAWILLGETPKQRDGGGPAMVETTCRGCGCTVADEWRLCPYCGVRLDVLTEEPGRGGLSWSEPETLRIDGPEA